MLICRGCNTRFETGRENCPSCGRRAKTHAVDASASDSGSGLPPAPPAPDELEEEPGGIDVELDESVIDDPLIDAPKRGELARLATPTPRPEPPAPAPARVAARRNKRASVAPSFALDSEQVRALLSEQPELIEKGLVVHADKAGHPQGIDFETPVGDIDLLVRDARGGFVIVQVPDQGDDADLVPGLLRRMGWVRKHLCSGGETVRAVAVTNDVPEAAIYAAAGLAEGVIRFVGYRVALEFHEHSA
jgi:hypothetical protein